MDSAFAQTFAVEWAEAWNAHDLDRILTGYSENVVFTSPKIIQLLGESSGQVRGKPALRAYWAEGLRRRPDLHFTVEDVRTSVDALVISYRDEQDSSCTEVLTFRDGLVSAGFGAYGPDS